MTEHFENFKVLSIYLEGVLMPVAHVHVPKDYESTSIYIKQDGTAVFK